MRKRDSDQLKTAFASPEAEPLEVENHGKEIKRSKYETLRPETKELKQEGEES